MAVRLAGATQHHPRAGPGVGRHEEGRSAVADRAAVGQFQRRGDRLAGQHVGHGERAAQLRAGVGLGMVTHQHRQLGQIGLGGAGGMQVAAGHQRVVGRHRRAVGHLHVGITHLGQGLDGAVTRLAAQAVFTGQHQHLPAAAGTHQVAGQHQQRCAGGAAQLHAVGIGRPQRQPLGHQRGQHQVRQRGGIAAQQAVDLAAGDAGVVQRGLGRLGHQARRGAAVVAAEGREADAGDVGQRGHGGRLSPARRACGRRCARPR